MRSRYRRLRREREEREACEEQQRALDVLEEENRLEERRHREDPLGYERIIQAHERTLEIIEEVEHKTSWSFFDSAHRGVPLPDLVQEALNREHQLRQEWLYGDSTSESREPVKGEHDRS